MPAQTFVVLLLAVISAAGLSILIATHLGLPLVALSLAAVAAALVVRFKAGRK